MARGALMLSTAPYLLTKLNTLYCSIFMEAPAHFHRHRSAAAATAVIIIISISIMVTCRHTKAIYCSKRLQHGDAKKCRTCVVARAQHLLQHFHRRVRRGKYTHLKNRGRLEPKCSKHVKYCSPNAVNVCRIARCARTSAGTQAWSRRALRPTEGLHVTKERMLARVTSGEACLQL